MKDVLSEIIAHKKIEVAEQKNRQSFSEIEKALLKAGDIPFHSLRDALANSSSGIIAEFKRRSPSKGWLWQSAEANEVTPAYEKAGAAALSVLTDQKYFGGTLADLRKAISKVSIPVIRKEFIIDEYQLLEAKLSGASAVLLIASAISVDECRRFTEFATQLQLEVLLELHDKKEMDHVGPLNRIIGINNRNLGSFVTDVDKSFKMVSLLPKEALWVSESGISDASIVKELRQAGYRGFLIGEYFMKSGNPGQTLKEFINQIIE